MENLTPTGIRSPDRPARSQPLYQLRYPAHQDINGDYKNVIITDNMDCPGIMGVHPDICSEVMLTTRNMTNATEKQVPRSLAFSFSIRMSSSCWLMAFFQSARSSSLLRFTGCCFGLTVPRPLSAGTQQTGDRSIRNVTVAQTFHLLLRQ